MTRFAARGDASAATVKKLVRERDNDRCVKCGMTAATHQEKYGTALEVHRLVPGSLYTLAGCITTCRPCNAKLPRLPWGGVDMEQRDDARSIGFELSPEVLDRLKAFAEERGLTIRHVIERAIVRHLDNPPPLVPEPPLPPCSPDQPPPAKGRKKKGEG